MTEYIEIFATYVMTLIKNNPQSSELIIFTIAFIESVAILGTIFPGTLLLTPIGIMIGRGILPTYETIILVMLGAFAGDIISYLIGLHYSNKLEKFRWIQKNIDTFNWFKDFINKHGALSLVIGRFIGPLRSSVPLFAGLLNMPIIQFKLGIIPSVLLWAIFYLGPGFILGSPEFSKIFNQIIIPTILIHNKLAWFALFFSISAYILKKIKAELSIVKALFFTSVFIILLIIVLSLPPQMLNSFYIFNALKTMPIDLANLISNSINIKTLSLLLAFYILFSMLSSHAIYYGIIKCIDFIMVFLISSISVPIIKNLIHIPRPLPLENSLINNLEKYSFPSGHLTIFTAVCCILAYHIPNESLKKIYYLLFFMFTIILAIARVSSGQHWPLDTLGGFLLGIIIANLSRYISIRFFHIDDQD